MLGIAIAQEALSLNYNILAFYHIRKERLLKLQERFPFRIKMIQATFSEQGASHAQGKLKNFEGVIGALVNNAGSFVAELNWQNLDPKVIMQSYAVNAMAPLLLSSYILEKMKVQKKVK